MHVPAPRPLSPFTPLRDAREVVLVPPDIDFNPTRIQPLVDAIERVGATLRIQKDPGPSIPDTAYGPLILVGNLRDNPWVRDLYYRFFCATDCTYPGPGGYEVRTLMNPLGSGHNIVHLGYSDAEGYERGLAVLIDAIAETLPFLSEIHATRLPLPDHYAEMIRTRPLPDLKWKLEGQDSFTHRGYLAYLTGDRDLLESSREIWQGIIDYGVPEGDFNVRDLHLRMSHIVCSFRLLECVGMIGDTLRGPFLEFIMDWIQSGQGVAEIDVPLYTTTDFPRQNHGLIPAMALAFFADYFKRHHPENSDWRKWQSVATRVFQPYENGSWKPLCDGLCHGWFLSQPPMLEYALLDPDHRYLESDGGRRAADCALAIINNQGWMPSSGDGTLLRAFPGPVLRVAAAWYRDGRYLFAHNLAERHRSERSQVFLPRAFDRGIEPTEPVDRVGLTVIELDPIVHRVFETGPDLTPGVFDTPPDAPIERCFDKLSFRSGWGRSDAFLLIDGLGSGSHAYADTLELIEYSKHGYSFLVSEAGMYHPETENHSVLTVVRDGRVGKVPSFAERLEQRSEPDGSGYVRLRLNNLNGTDWIREVMFIPWMGILIHDSVVARESGSFVLENHFRIPGKAILEAGKLHAHRDDETSGRIHFLLQGTCSHPHTQSLHSQDKTLRYSREPEAGAPPEENLAVAWRRRYGTDDQLISVFTSRSVLELQAGESVSFTHFARIRTTDEPVWSLEDVVGSQVTLREPGGSREFSFHETPTPVPLPPAPEPTERGRELPDPEILIECVADITTTIPSGTGGTVVGTEEGQVIGLGPAGEKVWEVRLEGRVHDIATAEVDGEATYYAGHGTVGMSRISRGKVLWTIAITPIPSYSTWWALFEASVVRLAVGRQANDTVVYAGCGDKILRGFSPDGKELWTFRYDNGVPARLQTVDLDDDGLSEVLVGGEIISNQSTCRILSATGTLLEEIQIEGWTSRLSALTVVKSGDYWILAAGTNRGENLQLYTAPSAAGTDASVGFVRRWTGRLGGEVLDLLVETNQNRLFAATTQGCLLCLDLDDGASVWNRSFPHAIARLVRVSDRLLIVDTAGVHRLLDYEGREVASGAPGLAWTSGFATDSGVVFSSGRRLMKMSVPVRPS